MSTRISPADLCAEREDDLPLHDQFLQITPHALGRLKYLDVNMRHDRRPATFSPLIPALVRQSMNSLCVEKGPYGRPFGSWEIATMVKARASREGKMFNPPTWF